MTSPSPSRAASIAPINPTPLPQTLAGTRVLVIGGSAGIGLTAGQLLAGVGAEVTLAARNADRLRSAAEAITEQHGTNIATELVDVTDAASVEALFAAVGSVDHVFVPAAGMTTGLVSTITAPERDTNIVSRLFGAHHIARSAIPRMAAGGSITFTSGIFVLRPRAGVALGAASLGAIESFTRALALELSPLRVNAIRPGDTDTPLYRSLIGADDGPAGDAAIAAAGAALPLGRVATPAEIAAAALFLMANSYVTGTVVTVDGGISIS